MRRQHVRKTTDAEETSSKSDNNYLQQTAQHVSHHAKIIRSGTNQDTVPIRIGDIDANVEQVQT